MNSRGWVFALVVSAAVTVRAGVKITYLADEGVMLTAGSAKVWVDAFVPR